MRYFKVTVQLGHHGRLPRETFVYIEAETIIKAMDCARNFPAVKHKKIPSKICEITKEEYEEGLENKSYYKAMETLNNGVHN